MIGMAGYMIVVALIGLWLLRRGRSPGKKFAVAAVGGIFAPIIANTTGWLFTEMGRQPWAGRVF